MSTDKAGIAALQAQYDKANRPLDSDPQSGDTWVEPFLKLADAWTGKEFAKGYTAPSQMSTADKNKLLEAIQTKKNDYAKTILQGVKDSKTGSDLQGLQNKFDMMQMLGQNNSNGNGAAGIARMESLRMKPGNDIDHDKIMTPLTASLGSLHRAQGMIDDNNTPVTAGDLQAMQQDIAGSLTATNNATEGKMGRDTFTPYISPIINMMLKSDHVMDLRKELPEIFAQLKKRIESIRGDIYDNANSRLDSIEQNYTTVQDPDIKTGAANKIAQLRKVYTRGKGDTTAVPSANGPSIDADLSKMTPAQVKEYIKTHGSN